MGHKQGQGARSSLLHLGKRLLPVGLVQLCAGAWEGPVASLLKPLGPLVGGLVLGLPGSRALALWALKPLGAQ